MLTARQCSKCDLAGSVTMVTVSDSQYTWWGFARFVKLAMINLSAPPVHDTIHLRI